VKQIIFSSVFEADFAEITAQFAVLASLETSLRWEEAVVRLTALLQKHPELGRIRRELRPRGIRTFVLKEFPDFLVFYRITATEIIFCVFAMAVWIYRKCSPNNHHELPHRLPLAAHPPAVLLERLHDLRVVWPFEIQAKADFVRHPHELGHCIF